jgi:hypothetical protein
MFALQDYSSVALKGSRETVSPRALAATNYRERGLASSTGNHTQSGIDNLASLAVLGVICV